MNFYDKYQELVNEIKWRVWWENDGGEDIEGGGSIAILSSVSIQ